MKESDEESNQPPCVSLNEHPCTPVKKSNARKRKRISASARKKQRRMQNRNIQSVRKVLSDETSDANASEVTPTACVGRTVEDKTLNVNNIGSEVNSPSVAKNLPTYASASSECATPPSNRLRSHQVPDLATPLSVIHPSIDSSCLASNSSGPCTEDLSKTPNIRCRSFRSVVRKPLSQSQATALYALSGRNKRRKRLSNSLRKRRKRDQGQSLYSEKSDEIKAKRGKRYQESPRFVQRLVDRVNERNMYHSARGYKERAKQRVCANIKRKYAKFAQYRQRVCTAAMLACKKQRRSVSFKQRIRVASSRYYLKRRKMVNRNRRVRYESYPGAMKIRRRMNVTNRQKKENASKLKVASSRMKVMSPLAKRKYIRQQRKGAPYLPPMHAGCAEAGAKRFRNWKRYRVNYILSHLGFDNDSPREHCNDYRLKKYEVNQLLHQVLNLQRELRGRFHEGASKISAFYEDAESEIANKDSADKLRLLREAYGGKRYHVPSAEHPYFNKADVIYRPFADVMLEDNEECPPGFLNVKVRLCNESCAAQISGDWPILLHNSLSVVNKNLPAHHLLKKVVDLERCAACDMSAKTVCDVASACADTVRLLLGIKMHFAGIRTLLREIYRLRAVSLQLHVIELLLLDGRYEDFLAFRKEYCSKNASRSDVSTDVRRAAEQSNDTYVLEKYGSLKAAFDHAVEASMEIYECHNCVELKSRAKLKCFHRNHNFRKRRDVTSLIKAYEDHFGGKITGDLAICQSCHNYFSRKKVSPYSNRNFMWPDIVPDELLRLNPYEQMVISLAKSFQKIVKLKPCTYKGPAGTLMRGIKGFAIHLPLPLGTLTKVTDILAKHKISMPRCSDFLIEVDSMPSMSTKNVYRSLVDMTVVKDALKWLMQNNPLYKNVVINEAVINWSGDDQSVMPKVIFTSSNEENPPSTASTFESDQELESKLVPSKRKIKCRDASYFDALISGAKRSDGIATCSEATGTGASAQQPTAADSDAGAMRQLRFGESGTVGGTSNSETSEFLPIRESAELPGFAKAATMPTNTMPGGQHSLPFIKKLNFPINYAVPYQRFWPQELANHSSIMMPVPEPEVLEEYSVIDMEHALPKIDDLKLFGLKPIKESPLAIDDPYNDVACYSHLYPYGRYGLYHKRVLCVNPAGFFEHQMRLSIPRFRRDLPYVFDCAWRKDLMALNSSMYTMLNNGAYGEVTVGEIRRGVHAPEKSPTLERNVSTLMRNIVSTPQYWLSVRLDLEAFTEEYGPATFFFTASCAEYKLDDFRRFLEIRNTDLPNVRNTSIRNLVSLDPVSVGLHFHNRFQAFWDHVIMADNSPLGKVEHYYMRMEYQQRGAPHMHILLWIQGAPIHGHSTDEEVLDFVTKHISCTLPDPVQSPELHRLVSQFQTHTCSSSCKRKKMVKGKCYCTYCRYGFPRAVNSVARLNSAEAVLEAKTIGKGKIKLYELPRRINEIMINDYNPTLLMIWGCNIDIQYIQDDKGCLIFYTTKYVCKSEKQKQSEIAESIDKNLTSAGMAKSFALKLLGCRQIGAIEAADKVLRHAVYKLSSAVKSTGFYHPKDMRRRLKPKVQLDKLEEESTDVFSRNFQNDYYPNRPRPSESLSANEMLQWYDFRYGAPVKDKTLYVEQYNVCFYKRKCPAVVRLWKPRGETTDDYERYCFQLLCLFKPFRNIAELLLSPDGTQVTTYIASFEVWREQLPAMQRYDQSKRKLAAMIEWANEVQRRVEKRLEHDLENGEAEALKDDVQDLDSELGALSSSLRDQLTEESVAANVTNLNVGQSAVFKYVIDFINERNSRGHNDNSGYDQEPKRLFVSGVGGTGKSFLIKTLRQYLEFYFSKQGQPAVLVAAPTGVAAANIDGVTIHKLLKLPVSKGSDMSQGFFPLHSVDSKTLRHLFANVKLLIVDEVSMLSNMTLMYIHKRLNEILVDEERDPYARFGNLNVLLLGDLLQLPPVRAAHIFKRPTATDIGNAFQSLGYSWDLWKDLFEYRELSQNMRQKDDFLYAEMLDRIRIGSPTKDDLARLRHRLIARPDDIPDSDDDSLIHLAVAQFLLQMEADPYALCILPLNDLVLRFNNRVMEVKKLERVSLKAVDSMDSSAGGRSVPKKKKEANELLKKHKRRILSTAETGGLEEDLILAVGARVMLRRNLDVTKKLVNGSIGFVEDIYTTAEPSSDRIHVRFQDRNELVPICRVKSKYYVAGGLYIERSQFPLTLAYAITVHKSQGLSLQSAIVDLGENTFSKGMAYVALSRVTNLSRVHLIRLSAKRIICDEGCVKEYNRLRACNNSRHNSLPAITNYNKNPEHDHSEKQVFVSSKTQADLLRLETELRAAVDSRAKASNPRKRPISNSGKPKSKRSATGILHPGMYLKLTNLDGHSCFANASLQCLLRCHDMFPHLQQYAAYNSVVRALLGYFESHSTSSSSELSSGDLRQCFGQSSQYSVQSDVNCDPAEFIRDVLAMLPADIAGLFRFKKRYVGTCPNSTCGRTHTVREDDDQLVEQGILHSLTNYTVQDVYNGATTLAHRCLFCGSFAVNFPVQAECSFEHTNSYLVLNNPVTYGGHVIGRALTGINERNLTLFNERWQLIACMQMVTSTPTVSHFAADENYLVADDEYRHYTAYVRHQDTKWIHLNDTAQQLASRRPVLKNMVILVLKRLSR